MSFLKKLFRQSKTSQPKEPVFPGESFAILKLNMPEGLAFATVNNAYKNYPNKSFYPFFVGVELEIIDKNDNGHPVDSEAEKLNQIQNDIENFLKKEHTVHSVARVTRNGARDLLIYIDTPKFKKEQISEICDTINKERQISFSVQKDSGWSAVSGFLSRE